MLYKQYNCSQCGCSHSPCASTVYLLPWPVAGWNLALGSWGRQEAENEYTSPRNYGGKERLSWSLKIARYPICNIQKSLKNWLEPHGSLHPRKTEQDKWHPVLWQFQKPLCSDWVHSFSKHLLSQATGLGAEDTVVV